MNPAEVAYQTSSLRSTIAAAIQAEAPEVIALSRAIHENPELSFEEHHAADAVASFLGDRGFTLERGTADLATAFVATAGAGPLCVGLFVEYDALPDIGHACGHNLIAGASLAAALGLKPVAEDLGITIKVFGAPAEEQGGGKISLLDAGALDAADITLMVHPVPAGLSYNPAGTSSQAIGRYEAIFQGAAAHAAAAPHLGVNAADAAVLAHVAIGLLRQQIPGDHRIALYTSEAGHATNIIPDRASVRFECRAFSVPEFEALLGRVRRCFEAAALATGTSLEISEFGPVYEPLKHDEILCSYWSGAISSLGYSTSGLPAIAGGSTDMGNVSQIIPSIHPWVGIPGVPHSIHSREFAAAADSPAAYDLMLDAGTALAWTASAVAAHPDHANQFILAGAARREPSGKNLLASVATIADTAQSKTSNSN